MNPIRFTEQKTWGYVCSECLRTILTNKTNIKKNKSGLCRLCWNKRKKIEGITEDHRRKIAIAKLGERNPNWKGNNVSVTGGNQRARSLFRNIGTCEKCGCSTSERHHKDGNSRNNDPSNILVVCRRCHMKDDGRMDKWLALCHSRKGIPVSLWPRKGEA